MSTDCPIYSFVYTVFCESANYFLANKNMETDENMDAVTPEGETEEGAAAPAADDTEEVEATDEVM